MKEYSVIIPAYNEELALPATLRALRTAMSEIPWEGEVIVVNNNSIDRTGQIALNHGARVVFEPVNQISRARNTGARAAHGRWLVFLDADTIAPRSLVETAVRAMRSGHVAGGGAAIAMDRPIGPAGRALLALWNWIARTFHVAAGSFVFCPREAFLETGGFSERVYAGEEIFFSNNLKRWGRKRGMEFRLLDHERVVTSARKVEWHGPWKAGGTLLLLAIFPFAIRYRSLCGLWYKRPAAANSVRG